MAIREEYVSSRNNAEKIKRKGKKETSKKTAAAGLLQEDLNGGKERIYTLAKAYRKTKEKICNIKEERGNVLMRPMEINTRWTNYLEDFFEYICT